MHSTSNTQNQTSHLDPIVKTNSANTDGKMHVLYSCGRMLEGHDSNYFESLQKIAQLTKRTTQRVEETILNGERKKIKSSLSLKKMVSHLW